MLSKSKRAAYQSAGSGIIVEWYVFIGCCQSHGGLQRTDLLCRESQLFRGVCIILKKLLLMRGKTQQKFHENVDD